MRLGHNNRARTHRRGYRSRRVRPTHSSAAWIVAALIALTSTIAAATELDGRALFEQHCAGCHEQGDGHVPSLTTLRGLNPAAVLQALTQGKMAAQGSALDDNERAVLVAWLSAEQKDYSGWEARSACHQRRSFERGDEPWVTRWGLNAANHRYQTATSINAGNIDTLEQAWVVAFPGAATMRSQPAVVGDTLFVAQADMQRLYAFDREQGCLRWSYRTESAPRTAVGFSYLADGRPVVYFGDANGHVHLIDARDGEPVWVRHLGVHPRTAITAAPLLQDGIMLVAHSSLETIAALDPDYECCQVPGALSAHDAATGDTLWLKTTVPPAVPRDDASTGGRRWGPAGASVWSAPLIDRQRSQVVIGTGPLSSPPETGTGDAVIAYELSSGKRRWVYQATREDFWNGACRTRHDGGQHPNCDFPKGVDHDFGAGIILARTSDGREIILAGQKSGTVHALDPRDGRLLWRRKVGDGSLLGGIHWGMALIDGALYVPNNDPAMPPGEHLPADINERLRQATPRPGLYKLAVDTGALLWAWHPERSCNPVMNDPASWPDCPPQLGLSGAALGIPGAVLSVGMDGIWRAHDLENGRVLREQPTAMAFADTVNGVPGKGGSIDNATLAAAGRYLYVQSGYGFFGGMPGNVLIAYRLPDTAPEAREE